MSSAPSGAAMPPARILDDTTLINSIVASALGFLISAGSATALFRRAWPKKQQFMADDSAIQFMTRRCQLLFVASILNGMDACRNLIRWAMLYEGSALPNFMVIRTLYVVTFLAALPLETYATCQRCAVIVTRKPELRKRGLRLALMTCVLCMLCAQAGSCYVVLDLSRQSDTDVDDWLNRRFAPIAIIAVMALLPLLILVSSVWALLAGKPAKAVRNKPDNKSSDAAKAMAVSTTSGSHSRVSDGAPTMGSGVSGSLASVSAGSASDLGSSSSSHTHSQAPRAIGSIPSSLPPSRRISILPSRTRSNLLSTSLSNISSLFHKKSRRLSAATKRHNKASLMYPLTRTFTVLTVALCVLWLFGLAASTLDFVPYVRSNALNTTVNAMAIALEASFELLIRVARRTQQKRQEDLAVDKTFAEDVIEERHRHVGIAEENQLNGSADVEAMHPSCGLNSRVQQSRQEVIGLGVVHESETLFEVSRESSLPNTGQPWGSL